MPDSVAANPVNVTVKYHGPRARYFCTLRGGRWRERMTAPVAAAFCRAIAELAAAKPEVARLRNAMLERLEARR